MFKAFAPAALLFAACASTPTPSGPSPKTSFETATYVSEVEVVLETDADDNEVMGTLEDCLVVKPAPGGAVDYVFQLHFAFDHECAMSGVAQPAGAGRWRQELEDGCILELSLDEGVWSLEDISGTCRDTFCGARGGISHKFGPGDLAPIDKCGE